MKDRFFKYILMCLLLAFLLSACTWAETERIRSYVIRFGEQPTSFQMQLTDSNNIVLYWGSGLIWVDFRSRGADGRRYDELAEQYNDLNYSRVTRFIAFPIGRTFVSNGITSIDVKSDVDFNIEHPAGTSLTGFVRLLSASPMRFIESGYRETFDWHSNYPADFLRETATFHRLMGADEEGNSFHPNHFPISEVLSELEPDDFRLLGTGNNHFRLPSEEFGLFFGFLVFDKEPENLGTHNLTVTIHRSGQGQVLSQTIEKTFGQP